MSALPRPRELHPLRDRFLRWQCRVRQIAMREQAGRPDAALAPALTLPGEQAPIGHIITVLNKSRAHSQTPEFRHLVRSTNDPAQRREKGLRLLSEMYYQKPDEFSETLTATFPPASPGAARIVAAGRCRLTFAAYAQRFELVCTVRRVEPRHPLYQATWWHNLLFNPDLPAGTVILGFTPDWTASSAELG